MPSSVSPSPYTSLHFVAIQPWTYPIQAVSPPYFEKMPNLTHRHSSRAMQVGIRNAGESLLLWVYFHELSVE